MEVIGSFLAIRIYVLWHELGKATKIALETGLLRCYVLVSRESAAGYVILVCSIQAMIAKGLVYM